VGEPSQTSKKDKSRFTANVFCAVRMFGDAIVTIAAAIWRQNVLIIPTFLRSHSRQE
jgi:hypothetical protein